MSNNRILSQLQQEHDKLQEQNKHDEQEIMLNKGDIREKVKYKLHCYTVNIFIFHIMNTCRFFQMALHASIDI